MSVAFFVIFGTGARGQVHVLFCGPIGEGLPSGLFVIEAICGAAAGARRALPFALDRLSTCLLAGMSVERALRVITPSTQGRLGVALTDGLAALDIGMTRAQAYQRIAERAGIDEVRSLMAAL